MTKKIYLNDCRIEIEEHTPSFGSPYKITNLFVGHIKTPVYSVIGRRTLTSLVKQYCSENNLEFEK